MPADADRPDAQLVAAYRNGDAGALAGLVERYRRPLFGYIVNMTRRHADADDVFQEVWFKAIDRIDRYRDDNFGGWLMRIAHNIVIDRSRKRTEELVLDDDRAGERTALVERLDAGGAGPGAALQDAELGRRIRTAVQALPPEQREVFLLRSQADCPFKEIARIQGTSINTALARMQYALDKLRVSLAGDYRELARGAAPG